MTVKINSIALWQDTLVQYATEWKQLHGENLRWTGLSTRLSSLCEILEYIETIDIDYLDMTSQYHSEGARLALYCHFDPRYRTVVITL